VVPALPGALAAPPAVEVLAAVLAVVDGLFEELPQAASPRQVTRRKSAAVAMGVRLRLM
jgi:hypothetical protein